MKLLSIIFIYLGESIAIYAEIIAAKNESHFFDIFFKMMILIILASVFLILGYLFGIKYFGNIWIVGVISIVSIVIMEPVIIYLIYHELPSKGPIIGFILGIFALISALFIR